MVQQVALVIAAFLVYLATVETQAYLAIVEILVSLAIAGLVFLAIADLAFLATVVFQEPPVLQELQLILKALLPHRQIYLHQATQ